MKQSILWILGVCNHRGCFKKTEGTYFCKAHLHGQDINKSSKPTT